jgi:hypothetical protein
MKNNFKKISSFLLLSSLLIFSMTVIAQDSAIVVFDGSGSMKKKMDGKPKFEIAQDVMGNLVKDWNEDIKLGLMVYGHRSKACDDIEMVIPIGNANPNQFIEAIKKIKPKGETPIAESLKQAAEKLNYIESPTTVILISDGEESCNADPCEMAKDLKSKGINLTVHVIGFDVSGKNKEKAQTQLKCIAKETGGKFFEAKDSEELKTALAETAKVVAEIEPAPLPKKKPIKVIKNVGLPFSDHFEREELDDAYEVLTPDADKMILSEGQLLLLPSAPPKNKIVLKQQLSGNFEASIKINMNLTFSNWTGIQYFSDEDNHLSLGLGWENDYRNIYFKKRTNGKNNINFSSRGKINKRNVEVHKSNTEIEGSQDWYFKIKKQGVKFTAYVSIDGKKWVYVGEQAFLKKGRIALQVGGTGIEDPIFFDNLTIKAIK